jgi:hypothetical protein
VLSQYGTLDILYIKANMVSVRLSVCVDKNWAVQGQTGQGKAARQKDLGILGYGFQDMVFKTWDLNFGAWEILGYGFQDMVFRTWDLNFRAWIFTLAVSKTET